VGDTPSAANPIPMESAMKNKVVLAALAAGTIALTAAGQTVDTVLSTNLLEPHSVAVDLAKNDFYITDAANNRIVKFISDTAQLVSLAGAKGQPGFVDNTGSRALFSQPQGIVFVPNRIVDVATNDQGIITTNYLPAVIVADSANNVIRMVTVVRTDTNMPPVGTVTTLAGAPGESGLVDGQGAAARFSYPVGLATDTAGNVFIADSFNNAIRKLDPNNQVTTVATGFNKPSAVTVGESGDLWVADTLNHVIRHIASDGTVTVVAGTLGVAGAVDADFATSAQFNSPQGVLWIGGATGLLVSDTGNHAVRQVVFNADLGDYSVVTLAGTLTQPGFANGSLNTARFNSPVGLARDQLGAFLVADLANNAIRRIQRTPPQPQVQTPAIGIVDFVKDPFGELLSKLTPVNRMVFNNDVNIQILSEQGTVTYFNVTNTVDENAVIPDPGKNDQSTSYQYYHDGLKPDEVLPSLVSQPEPELTIRARSFSSGRLPSVITEARFQFNTANPIFLGDNAASFVISNITQNAFMWYTVDGSDPTNNNDPAVTNQNATSIGPILSGTKISLVIKTNTAVRARAFRDRYKPSEIAQKQFVPDNSKPNQITFGFETGEASSDFVAAVGQSFYAPVTLTLVPNQKIYSLQFNVTVTNLHSSPPVTPGAVGFQSMLMKPLPGANPPVFVTIPPAMFNPSSNALTGLLFTNSSENLLGIGWLERLGFTNLYDTVTQDLITYSQPHDRTFLSSQGKVALGAYSFTIPANATPGATYEIQINRPSATDDGIASDVFIDAPTDGSLTNGAINSIKHVSIGQRIYLVGDVSDFHWLNAGDFGDTNLLNNDVLQVFQSAAYNNDTPPRDSDFFDAMDSSDGSQIPLDGNDTSINAIAYGDGQLNVDDVFVTYRRSLDPSLTWYVRYWTNGVRAAADSREFGITNHFRAGLGLQAKRPTRRLALASIKATTMFSGAPPSVAFAAGPVQGAGGQAVVAPIQAQVTGDYPVRVLMMNLQVTPQNGAPPLTQPVQFVPVAELGQPTLTSSQGPDNYAAAWLDNTVPGVYGTNLVGNLRVVLPDNAGANASYKIEFQHVSASPNGVALFPVAGQAPLVAQTNPDASSWGDGIPDSWRLEYFGTLTDPNSAANADPDRDGLSNLAEFIAGTNPRDPASCLQLLAAEWRNGDTATTSGILLRWQTISGRHYTLECTADVVSQVWTPVANNLAGDGGVQEFLHTEITAKAQFYRVRIAD
jgi:hypothetical protein